MVGDKSTYESVRAFQRNRHTKQRRLPCAVASVAHLVLAFAILFGIVQSGGRYFYCEAFGLLPFDPCAEATGDAQGKSPLGMLSERSADCCEIVTLAAMPQGAQAAGPRIPPAACVALIPTRWLAGRIDSTAPSQVDRAFKRWRPPPRTANDVRAQRMVFLI